METDDELEALREELAGVARETARELIKAGTDMARVQQLDRRAAGLRARIRALTPLRVDWDEPRAPPWWR